MKTIVENILGTYSPSGDTFAGADWAFIFSGIILTIGIYCIFRILGSLFK